ncbi:MAG: hypothetical protein JWM95_2185 [Gemmatimonadetes bacterium]|nr:hypothetical protein [Gemmatimonadota bacterium]
MRLQTLAGLVLVVQHASAQIPGATVRGVVRDSINRVPLAGAVVQLAAADGPSRFGRSSITDSLGQYTLGDIPDGRYTIGFFHPVQDSLGIEPMLQEVNVTRQQAVFADLAIPSAARLRTAVCGSQPGAAVVGMVLDARTHEPVADVSVTAQWLELSFGPQSIGHRTPSRMATTRDNGWFSMCNVPSPGTMVLVASRGADSTDRIEMDVPADGFLRREIYLGAATTTVVNDTARLRRVHTGDGRLSGTVMATSSGAPLSGAQISLVEGPQTRTNERGEWTMVDAPAGTRMIEVRAIGYYPERRRVDVIPDAKPIHISLSTLKAVLDTMKVSALRPGWAGFLERRRSGVGHYFTAADVTRRQPLMTSDLFRSIAGVRTTVTHGMDKRFVMRGTFTHSCSPVIYINDRPMHGLTADELDTWIRPSEIAGIEIYNGPGLPVQYQYSPASFGGNSVCGAIVIWMK